MAKGMKAVYPNPNFLPDDYARDVWYALLKDIPYPDANRAVMEILKTSPHPPTVADITGRVYRRIAGNEMTETEAWSRVRVAIRNSGYNAETEFAKLPEACQRAVGSAANLRELALMDAETVESVEQSHFVKIFRSVVDRQEKAGQTDIRRAIEWKKQEAARLLEAEKEPMPKQENYKNEESYHAAFNDWAARNCT